MKNPICDPHVHFFNLEEGQYYWLQPQNSPHWPDKSLINKNFSEQDISHCSQLALKGYVHIEAGFNNAAPWREIKWLTETCNLPMRSIAFLDVTQAAHEFSQNIIKLQQFTSLAGIRHIIDDEVTRPSNRHNVAQNLLTLQNMELIFELQLELTNKNKSNIIYDLLLKTPDLKVCINHAGFAPLKDQQAYREWQKGLTKLALLPNCWLKVSGFELLDRQYSKKNVEQVLADCVNVFGESRVMLASNFPLVNFTCDYQTYWLLLINVTKNLGLNTSALTLNNAMQFYGFT